MNLKKGKVSLNVSLNRTENAELVRENKQK